MTENDIAIRVENLGKSYLIGHQKRERYTTLRDSLVTKFKHITNKSRQLFNSGQLLSGNDLEEFWALKEVSFEIKQGESLGIIGRNGAGKSTLLKVLSRITEPTLGKIQINGRVTSLLEVGTGFHPELSGRENIYLNGAILGMNRIEIKRKFDEIVDFAGTENFLDTPVKRYSSGMYVRLAFAVAAHLESEILIIDEVLAVGDAEFQKKCLNKMDEISKGEGRTVIFVSHNLGAIQSLCTTGLLLEKGKSIISGPVEKVIKLYNDQLFNKRSISLSEQDLRKRAYVSKFSYMQNGKFVIDIMSKEFIEKINIGIGINDSFNNRIVTFYTKFYNTKFSIKVGNNSFLCQAENFPLKPGIYSANIFIGNEYETFDYVKDPVEFEIDYFIFYPTNIIPDTSQGSLLLKHNWSN